MNPCKTHQYLDKIVFEKKLSFLNLEASSWLCRKAKRSWTFTHVTLVNRKSPPMGLNETSISGHQMVGMMWERKPPVTFRQGLLALVNATKRYRGERGEYQGPGTTWDSHCHPYAKSPLRLPGVVTPWEMREIPLQLWHSDLETSLPRQDNICCCCCCCCNYRVMWY